MVCLVDSLFNGYGTMVFVNGNRYDGEWFNGKQNGHGVFTDASGNRREGEWTDGKFVRVSPSLTAPASPSPPSATIAPTTNNVGGTYCFDKTSEKFVLSSSPCGPP
jgi:hypothetical protein